MLFKPRSTFSTICWNIAIIHLVLGYVLAIPQATVITWNAINKTFLNLYINPVYTQCAFALGACLSLGFDLKGAYRKQLIKCDIALALVFISQPILPFAIGAFVCRFLQGIILSLDIRYSEKYMMMIIQPIYLYQRHQTRQSVTLFGFRNMLRLSTMFIFGSFLAVLFGSQLPSEQGLKHIKYYDDSLLWYLLNALPVVLIAVRLINLSITFGYDGICESNQEQNEHFLANIFKKKHVEEAWEMLACNQLDVVLEDIEGQNWLLLVSATGQLCGTILIVTYSYELLLAGGMSQNIVLHYVAGLTAVCCLGTMLTNYLSKKLHLEIIFVLSLVIGLIGCIIFMFASSFGSGTASVIGLMVLALSNGIGISSVSFGMSYYTLQDESLQFRSNLICWLLFLMINLGLIKYSKYAILATLVFLFAACILFCNRFSQILSNVQNVENPDSNELESELVHLHQSNDESDTKVD